MTPGLIIPAYFYPTSPEWAKVFATRDSIYAVIINPYNGPFTKSSDDHNAYVELIARLKYANIKMFGYVSTRWGQRDKASVLNEIKYWKDTFGVMNIFLDEGATVLDQVNKFTEYRNAIPGECIMNPGTVPDEKYFQMRSIICMFESHISKLQTVFNAVSWMNRYRKQMYYIVFDCQAGSMAAIQGLLNGSFYYLTDQKAGDKADPEFARLPRYWSVLAAGAFKAGTASTASMVGMAGAAYSILKWLRII